MFWMPDQVRHDKFKERLLEYSVGIIIIVEPLPNN
jgi:hypothetical protein